MPVHRLSSEDLKALQEINTRAKIPPNMLHLNQSLAHHHHHIFITGTPTGQDCFKLDLI